MEECILLADPSKISGFDSLDANYHFLACLLCQACESLSLLSRGVISIDLRFPSLNLSEK